MDHQQFDYIIRMMNCALQVSHVSDVRDIPFYCSRTTNRGSTLSQDLKIMIDWKQIDNNFDNQVIV